ncbi:BppU family phage baseplate upper protein [Clostridium perfringens]|uniref:BppU family phage baseplate upper protein n=1 Tax=Clostridium perfringens TaxID=1502 RepID=UPI0039EBB82C
MKNLEINTLNINSNSLLNIATFRQEDNATLMLELYKNGQSIDLAGQKIILGAERSDGSIIEQEEDISTNENIVTIKLKKNILAVNGLVKMQLTLSDREGTMSTTSFNINVDRKILGAENIKASNDIETINSLVLDLKTNVNKAITDTKDKASTLLSGLEDTANSVELKVNALTDISNGLLKNLENQCKDSTIINTELSNNIKQALPINTELKENIKIGQPLVQETTSKNTELQASLEETKKYIDGLDGSQNIPQIRLDVTELQNGLKNNQALAYQGSSISANDTLESRTEGMRIKGRTLKNIFTTSVNNLALSDVSLDGNTFIVNPVKGRYPTLYDLDGLYRENTNYTVVIDILENTLQSDSSDMNLLFGKASTESVLGSTLYRFDVSNGKKGRFIQNVKTIPDFSILTRNLGFKMYMNNNYTGGKLKFNIMVIETSMLGTKQIPSYFGGIKSFGEAEQEGDKYKISILSTGKNLFDGQLERGNLNSNTGQETDGANTIVRTKNFIRCKGNTNYIISCNSIPNVQSFSVICWYDVNKNYIGNSAGISKPNAKYFRFRFRKQDGSTITDEEIKNFQVQFEEGTSATTYEPYKEDKKDILIKEPLRSKGDICDLLYEDNGQVKIDRYVGIRKYQEGDENNKEVITDKINTVYILDKPVTEIVENCVDIDLDTFQDKTYFSIENSLPGTLDFKVPSNIASIVQNTAREVNNIWDVINNLLVPSLIDINKNVAMSTIKNNLK